MTATRRRKRRASPKGPGFTISEFVEEVGPFIEGGLTPTVVRTAITRQEITAIKFNGVLRIPPREMAKFIAIWGKQESADVASESKVAPADSVLSAA